ncbi:MULTISPECIES: hypothetical protein [unclassified Moorena]|uniref:hypothetical protein n=1 Tax=unclassified Moorena TaxID=2683338 RepID=UPI0013B9E3A3|nr:MULTISPECIES: hypothetical protein [unclassified Moorena]NEQ10269.1 hypothetical protein [Moorena sp. SIO4E2]NER91760.1 hypothetical protein [Moorena sp. SIO3A2]
MLVLKIFIVSICATRTLREQPSAVSRQLKAHATGTAYSNSLCHEVQRDPPKSPLSRGTLRLKSVPHKS